MTDSIDGQTTGNRKEPLPRPGGGSGEAHVPGRPREGRWVAHGGERRGVVRALGAVLLAALVGGAGLLASVRPAAEAALPGGPVLAYNPYNLVRLHVLAATDDPEDQALKMRARDAVVSFLASRWGGVRDTAGALAVLEANRQELARLLEHLVASSGRDYGVTVEVGYFPFPERDYGRLTLPAGTYPALRVILGEGKGQNWWCVLFPPLCFLDSRVTPPGTLPLSPEETALLLAVDTGGMAPARIQVRSFLLDWLRRRGVDPGAWVQRWREGSARP
ncbi:MAG: stage II sporulation protein R [Firmicutes bacterium]|nr:stage II sporulation protein R [Bacillota bacterium]